MGEKTDLKVMAESHLNNILNTADNICIKFKTKSLPFNTFSEIIKIAKLKPNKEISDIVYRYNEMLDILEAKLKFDAVFTNDPDNIKLDNIRKEIKNIQGKINL